MKEPYIERKVKEHMIKIEEALQEEDFDTAQAHGEEILKLIGYTEEDEY